jgi:hypothetical protein
MRLGFRWLDYLLDRVRRYYPRAMMIVTETEDVDVK